MLSQVVINQVICKEELDKEATNNSRIHEFLRMNPPCFTCSSTTKDLESFINELKNVFDVRHISNTQRVELPAYQMKSVARIWFY